MSKKEATLKNWYKHPFQNILIGEVYGHPYFKDGSLINTSLIKELNNNKCETLNTVYTLEDKVSQI